MTQPWEWRKAASGVWIGDDDVSGVWYEDGKRRSIARVFHAYDVNDNAACEPTCGLIASCEEPNEGSVLCTRCIEVMRAAPAGREERIRVR